MIRSKDLRVMQSGLHDVLKMLEETPLFEQETDSYLKAIAEAKKFDGQVCSWETSFISSVAFVLIKVLARLHICF